MALQHDGSHRILNNFTQLGVLQYSELVTAKDDYVVFITLAQINYKMMESNKVHMNKDSAIAAARAILKHFNVGVE